MASTIGGIIVGLSFHVHSLRELLEPALRDFHEASRVPRQMPFGLDSQVQIANQQPPKRHSLIVAIWRSHVDHRTDVREVEPDRDPILPYIRRAPDKSIGIASSR
jgi:hypothetical protein